MTELTELELEQAIDNCPALAGFHLHCYEVDAGIATIMSSRYLYRRLVSIEDLQWILKYWASNGVYGDLPVDAPISALSMLQFQHLSERIEQEAKKEDAGLSHPMVTMLESDYVASIAKIKELNEQVSALEIKLAGMTIDRDAPNAPNAPKAKKRKAKVSNEEKIALMWLRLPSSEEELWGIARLESGGFIAYTDWSDFYFQTISHAIAYLTVWADDGFRPALSNLRIGNKPMDFNRRDVVAKATRATMIMDADKALHSVPELAALKLNLKLHFEGIESAITLVTVRSSRYEIHFSMVLSTLMSVLGEWGKNGVYARFVGARDGGFATSESAFEKWTIRALGGLEG